MTASWVHRYVHGDDGSKDVLLSILASARQNFEALADSCGDEDLILACEEMIASYEEVERCVRRTTRGKS